MLGDSHTLVVGSITDAGSAAVDSGAGSGLVVRVDG